MNRSEVLNQLKEALKEEPELLKLSHEDPRRNMWVYRVDNILRDGFGANSDELKLFVEGVPRDELKGSNRELQNRLDSRLMRRATVIRSIIEKHERQKETVNPDDMEFYKGLQGWLEELELFQKQLQGNVPRDELEPTRDKLIRSAPKFKRRVIELTGKQYGEQFGRTFDVWDEAFSRDIYDGLNWSNRFSLDVLVDCIKEGLGVLEAGESATSVTTPAPSKAFIAHGGETAALNKLRSFLEALGVEPLVAEIQPSEGRLTEPQVDEYMKQADCAVILATYGHIVDQKTRKKHPRLNVVDELGRCRKVFPHRTILLLEKGVDLPSNVSGIVHERFTKQNMEKALIKVARELRAFGLIKTAKG
jgi:predicted nucleotide-binding protein